MKLYLDLCCFNRPFDDQSSPKVRLETEAKLEIQEQVRSGQVELVWSYILEFENSRNPNWNNKQSIKAWEKIALHLACAKIADCDYFLATDQGILSKRVKFPEIKILNPIEYIIETGSE